MVDVEEPAQCGPQGGCKLGPSVEGDGGWHFEPGDPAGENRALAQLATVTEGSGIASGHRDVLSITVNR
jgi:hypothetical protein